MMFSTTTMASSTTKPVEIVSAISVRLLRLKPRKYITANVPPSANGTVIAGTSVLRQSRKNTYETMVTSTTAASREISTSAIEARIVCVPSSTTPSLTPAGNEACKAGRVWRIASTISMTLPFGSFDTISSTACLPFDKP